MLKDDSATLKRQEKMNRQANASAKSNVICFCPNTRHE